MTTATPHTGGRRTRVLLADDSEGLRLLVRSWLTSEDDLEVVAEATNGAEAVALADAHRPDVVVMDVAMPVMDGLEALSELHRRFPELPVVMHSGFAEGQVARQATARGAWGFVEKSGDLEPLVQALRTAALGLPVPREPAELPPPRRAGPPVEVARPAPEPAAAPEPPPAVAASPASGQERLLSLVAALVLLGLAVGGPVTGAPAVPGLLAMTLPVVVLAVRHGRAGGLPAAVVASVGGTAWALSEPGAGIAHAVAALLAFGSIGLTLGSNVDSRRRVEQRQQQVAAAVEASNRALAQANDRLRLLNLDLQASNDDLRQFGHIAGHDLVEPLRNIRSFSDLLQQRYAERLDDRGRQYLHFVVDGVTRMQSLVDDLRAYTRAGQAELHLVPVALDVVVQDVQASLRLRLAERHARVRVGPLPVVQGDRSLLGLVLQNLLSNALTFNESGAPVVEISAERVGDHWRVHVRDDGIGVDPARADAVFGLFTRLHTREEYPGTGLGLAITKRIVERHGGTVALAPRPGGGTTATVTLPAGPVLA